MRKDRLLGLISVGCAFVALLAPTAASAACSAPTPAAVAHDDPADDAEGFEVTGATPEETAIVTAPEITRVTGTFDGSCSITYDATLALPPGETEPLVERESLRYYLDIDANAATGGTVTGAEWLVLVDGANGPDRTSLLRWNGAAFAEQRAITPAGTVGFTLPLAVLGIQQPTTLGVRVHSRLVSGGTGYVDLAPDRAVPQMLLPLQWAVPAPPPVVPVGPASTPPATTTPTCVVPTLRGKTVAAARIAVRRANCTAKIVRRASRKVRRGKVITTTPAAGMRTIGTITVIVSSGPPKKRKKKR